MDRTGLVEVDRPEQGGAGASVRLPRGWRFAGLVGVLAGSAAGLSEPAADPRTAVPAPAPLFEVAVGAAAPIGGAEQNRALLPCGGGPPSLQVAADGTWWILDAIGSKLVGLSREGAVLRTLDLPSDPTGPAGVPPYRSDFVLDGEGGVFVLNATARRVEHYALDGSRSRSFGNERISAGRARLELPERIGFAAGDVFVADGGSELLLRFSPIGEFRGSARAAAAEPAVDGGTIGISGDDPTDTWIESAPPGGHPRPVARVKAAVGRVLHDVVRIGGLAGGESVLALHEGDGEAVERVHLVRLDRNGRTMAEAFIPPLDDGVKPTRRFRLAPDGTIAWFRVEDGRLQAFETALGPRIKRR